MRSALDDPEDLQAMVREAVWSWTRNGVTASKLNPAAAPIPKARDCRDRQRTRSDRFAKLSHRISLYEMKEVVRIFTERFYAFSRVTWTSFLAGHFGTLYSCGEVETNSSFQKSFKSAQTWDVSSVAVKTWKWMREIFFSTHFLRLVPGPDCPDYCPDQGKIQVEDRCGHH